MTVKELIAKLQEQDQDLKVVVIIPNKTVSVGTRIPLFLLDEVAYVTTMKSRTGEYVVGIEA